MSEDKFQCDQCGLCCQHLELFGEIYRELDDGTGVCRYFDKENNLCKIYAYRPIICRVEEGYEAYFKDVPYKEYIRVTKESCNRLKQRYKQPN